MRKFTLLFAVIFTLLGTGCVIGPANLHARPSTHVVINDAPPQRVFHNGKWLYYRADGYYFLLGSAWVYAKSVPAHVRHHHVVRRSNTAIRINRPSHHYRHRHHRRSPVQF